MRGGEETTTMESGNYLQIERFERIYIATVQGATQLDASNANEFGAELVGWVQANPGTHILVNFHHVTYISSAVLSQLLRARAEAEKHGGSIRVCALNKDLMQVFRVTQLDKLFHAVHKVRQAADEFSAWVQTGAKS
jgi:anti-sigma B factor antagonist